jgi:beta-glucosidase
LQTVSALALKAGIDMDMVGEGFLTTLKKSLEEGKITIQEIDAAVTRILEAKYDLGLFHDPYKNCNEARAKTDIYTPQHREFARKVRSRIVSFIKKQIKYYLFPKKELLP